MLTTVLQGHYPKTHTAIFVVTTDFCNLHDKFTLFC